MIRWLLSFWVYMVHVIERTNPYQVALISLHHQVSSLPQFDILVISLTLSRIAEKYTVQGIGAVVIEHVKKVWPDTRS